MGSSFQTLGVVTEKAQLPRLSLVLGTISCEMDYLSCIGIREMKSVICNELKIHVASYII